MCCGAWVSRLATFRLFIGRCARAGAALTCAYARERHGNRPGVLLKVARGDTGREASQQRIPRPRVLGVGLRGSEPNGGVGLRYRLSGGLGGGMGALGVTVGDF